MGKTHDLKCWPEPFWSLVDGDKTCEWRKDDRGYAVGDVLHQREWVPVYVEGTPETGYYTGRSIEHLVSHIIKGPAFGIPEGYCMMSIRPLADANRDGGG